MNSAEAVKENEDTTLELLYAAVLANRVKSLDFIVLSNSNGAKILANRLES